ncbi:MAG TPA: HAD hydrolase-like protein [Longimicrobiales bacterium]|nr:HAD hydrolase-like protein [Longimicrobiales bacterium]
MKRLVLFDIDGTLLTARSAPRRAFTRAMLDVYGTTGPIDSHRFDGKTDPQIARELLTLAGFDNAVISAGLEALWQAYVNGLRQELAAPDHATHVFPGIRTLLTALESMPDDAVLGLLTGNIRAGADLKLRSASLDYSFRVGAFGSDCERRDGLPPVAVARARDLVGVTFHRDEVVIIGDTPSDVTCGQALGVRAIAVATGGYSAEELDQAGAHTVFTDLTATDRVLDAILA